MTHPADFQHGTDGGVNPKGRCGLVHPSGIAWSGKNKGGCPGGKQNNAPQQPQQLPAGKERCQHPKQKRRAAVAAPCQHSLGGLLGNRALPVGFVNALRPHGIAAQQHGHKHKFHAGGNAICFPQQLPRQTRPRAAAPKDSRQKEKRKQGWDDRGNAQLHSLRCGGQGNTAVQNHRKHSGNGSQGNQLSFLHRAHLGRMYASRRLSIHMLLQEVSR